jgi:GNAT superfamily N-acetyltransferase
MSNSISVRNVQKGDLTELSRLNKLFNGTYESPDELNRRITDPNCVEHPLIAEINGKIIGFAAIRIIPCVFSSSPRGELTELFVEENYRRQGVGKELINYAEAIARDNGVNTMFILTNISNLASRSLYNSIGYRENDMILCKEL